MTTSALSLQNYTLLIAGIINLIMSILVFSRGVKHNKINLYFSFLTFFNFLWAIGLLLASIFTSNIFAETAYRTSYLAAVGIAVSLFYFSLVFPYKTKSLKMHNNLSVLIFSAIISIFIYSKWHIIFFKRGLNLSDWVIDYYKPFYIIYSLFFLLLVISAICFLANRLHNLESWLKNKVKILLATIIIGLIFGVYFDLIICYFGNFKYIWFGPIFTAFMNGYVFYLIFHHQDK